MDFSWSPAQLAAKQSAIAFAQEHLSDDVISRDRESVFSRALWKKCANYGIQGLASTPDYGGSGGIDILTAMLVMEGLGYGCPDNGLIFALNAHTWTTQFPIEIFGSDELKKSILPRMVSGEWIGAHAVTETKAGSDAYQLETLATRCEGGYRLSGSKRLVSLAPLADVFLVFATVDPKLGKWGITAFVVERDWEGVETSPVRDKMGLRTVPIGEVTFSDCFVPDTHRMGKEGAGFSISSHSLEYERCSILAGQLGAMERQLETAITFAREREQFGAAVGSFQSVSNRIVDMKLRLETARLLLYKVAWMKKNDQPAIMEAALLKLYLGECFVESSLDAIRTHGGVGYLSETGVERDLRDAIGGVIYAGTSDIQRNIVAGMLGL